MALRKDVRGKGGELLRLTVYRRITEEVKSGATRYPESLTYILLSYV